MPAQQGGIVGNGAARGIENQAASRQAVKEPLVTQVPGGPLAVGVWKVMMSQRRCNSSSGEKMSS